MNPDTPLPLKRFLVRTSCELCGGQHNPQFVLHVSCANEYLDGFDAFVVEISPEYARILLERINLLEAVQKQDKDAFELYFWDPSGDYFGGDPDEPDVAGTPSRAECQQLVVREDEVNWVVIPKHTDLYVTTDPIRATDLAEIAASLR